MIALPGNVKLACRMWLPKSASIAGSGQVKYPGILEFIPYRKRDFTAHRDESMHPFLASRGYICLRVDMRGTGDSDGVLEDEYLPSELQDAISVIQWLSKQPYCTGDVGMMGKSWGGFNALQVAALKPKELKAIITVCSTDDRYNDDIHHLGGTLLVDNLTWSAFMLKHLPLPPDPAVKRETIGAWRRRFENRISLVQPWILTWLKHQRRDYFYKHGSICENYSDIEIPVFCVGGWADLYTRPIFRMMEHLECPKKALIGPWSHIYPHQNGNPGPSINFLEEMAIWWDEWLKGFKYSTFFPNLQIYLQKAQESIQTVEQRDGTWIGLDSWPSDLIVHHNFYFTPSHPGELKTSLISLPLKTHLDNASIIISNHLGVGIGSPRLLPFGLGPEYASAQNRDDEWSTCFTSEPLSSSLNILGPPIIKLTLISSYPDPANIIVRLCDIHPNTGTSSLITWGALNLTHRISHETPCSLPTDSTPFTVTIELKHTSYMIEKDHCIRIGLSTSYWPLVWPSAKMPELKIVGMGQVIISLLEMECEETRKKVSPFILQPARSLEPKPHTVLRKEMVPVLRLGDRNEKRVWTTDSGATQFSDGWVYGESGTETYTILDMNDPTSVAVKCHYIVECGRPSSTTRVGHENLLPRIGLPGPPVITESSFHQDGENSSKWRGLIRTETDITMECDRTDFIISASIQVMENGKMLKKLVWNGERIARDFC